MSILQIINHPAKSEWAGLLARPVNKTADLTIKVGEILADIKARGDAAVDDYSWQFERQRSPDRQVHLIDFDEAVSRLDEKLKEAIITAIANITAFHKNQFISESSIETSPGIKCWRKSVPIEKVGLYIPGGTAPLFSTLLMLGIPATLAGCDEIIVCTPPMASGKVHPAILFCAKLMGVHKVFGVGGVQAIGAMAYGTETIPSVYKIFGPGNQYVTHAKKLVQQDGLAIDMPAGPSELVVWADQTGVPQYVAADLLSQCEHGPDSQVLLITDSTDFAEKVNVAIKEQLDKLPRKLIVLKSLENSKIIVMADRWIAMDFINLYAPEHLIIACEHPDSVADLVRNAGSVFIGNFAPEAAGDYASGTNHTLPTNGFARAYSGVSMDSFFKKISFQKLSRDGLKSIESAVIQMAMAEGLEGHAAAVKIRFNS